METPQKRLEHFIKEVFGTKKKFTDYLGVHFTWATQYTKINGSVIKDKTIIDKLSIKGFNHDWYISGKGEMLIKDKPVLNNNNIGVPYYDIDATATFTESFNDMQVVPQFYIDFKPFNNATAYINVVGDSMHPVIENGSIIAIREIKNKFFIDWGKVYFIITDSFANNMKVIKTVHRHEDDNLIILRSYNKNYAGDMILSLNNIISMFIVVGKISKFEFN